MSARSERLDVGPWPDSVAALESVQSKLAEVHVPPWIPTGSEERLRVAGCFVCFPRVAKSLAGVEGIVSSPEEARARARGRPGDPGWAASALIQEHRLLGVFTCFGQAKAAYDPGHLALREGPLLEEAVRKLPQLPDVLLVNATGRDHPRRAGLAFHLGAKLDVPTVGVTNRLLLASGEWPEDVTGATSFFFFKNEAVGIWLRVRRGVRPLAIHAAWRTDVTTALAIVRSCLGRSRTPEPLRMARRAAREERNMFHNN